MMKLIIIPSILLFSASVLAHNNFSSQSCDVELNADIRVTQKTIEFSQDDTTLYQIIDDKNLYAAGDNIKLSKSQQRLVTEYSENIRAVMPEIKAIALEGIDLAIQGVDLAFDQLLGQDNNTVDELTEQLELIADEIETKFNQDYSINERGIFINDQNLNQAFEQRIEKIIEQSISASVGSLFLVLGQQMLSSDDDSDTLTFEQKMENFSQKIAHEMESRANKLEYRANKVCQTVHAIDTLEEQLKVNIKALSDIDLLSIDLAHVQKR